MAKQEAGGSPGRTGWPDARRSGSSDFDSTHEYFIREHVSGRRTLELCLLFSMYEYIV